MTPKRTTSSTDGLELAYWVQRAAAASDECLMLLHGGASNHTRWSEFVDQTRLTAAWNLVSPDMRGSGATMTRGRQDMSLWCADLLDILAAEGSKSAVIAGHSLGAQIAVNFAHGNPAKTRGLILIDPVFQSALRGRQRLMRRYRWLVKGLTGTVRLLNSLGLRRRNIKGCDLRKLDAETRLAIQGDESLEEIAKRYSALGPILRHTPTANYLRQALEVIHPLPPLSDIDLPVLVLLSGGTTLANLDRNREEVASFPDSEIVTLDANHWPLTETPDAVRDAIEEWLLRRFDA